MAYLEERETTRLQYRAPRREKPVGIIVVHTAESILDSIGPDTGAENVASFIATRSDPGSYHDIVDADSVVNLVSYENEAFHVATHRLNRRTTGLSFACRTTDWARMTPPQRAAFLRQGARAAVAQMLYHGRVSGIVVPIRLISLKQALDGEPGYLPHAAADPARRSDPGADFPWAAFFAEVARQWVAMTAPTAPAPPPVTRRSAVFFVRQQDQPHVWITDGITRRHVPDATTLERLQGVARWGLTGAERDAAATIYVVANEAELTALAGNPAPDGVHSDVLLDVEALAQTIARRTADEIATRIAQ